MRSQMITLHDHATTVKLLIQWLGETLYLHFILKGKKMIQGLKTKSSWPLNVFFPDHHIHRLAKI